MSARTCEDSDLTSLSPRVEETCLLEASLYRCKNYHVMRNSHDHQSFTFWSCGGCEIEICLVNFCAERKGVGMLFLKME